MERTIKLTDRQYTEIMNCIRYRYIECCNKRRETAGTVFSGHWRDLMTMTGKLEEEIASAWIDGESERA